MKIPRSNASLDKVPPIVLNSTPVIVRGIHLGIRLLTESMPSQKSKLSFRAGRKDGVRGGRNRLSAVVSLGYSWLCDIHLLH